MESVLWFWAAAALITEVVGFIKLLFPRFITDPSVSRPTPLYGQPSWWGEDDEHKGQRCDPSVHEHHTGQKQSLLNHQTQALQRLSTKNEFPDACWSVLNVWIGMQLRCELRREKSFCSVILRNSVLNSSLAWALKHVRLASSASWWISGRLSPMRRSLCFSSSLKYFSEFSSD